jgi:ergothioneine biosynthesis protein EgtB
MPAVNAAIDTPAIRGADRDRLSLALMDARNYTLQLLAHFEQALGAGLLVPRRPDTVPPVWLAGHAAWLAEYWIARNPQRGLGACCPADAMRIGSVEPQADAWFDPTVVPHAQRWSQDLPPLGEAKAYLLDTLETTLELLEKAGDGDDALYFFRMALFHEDWRGEQLAMLAQALGVPLGLQLAPGAPARAPLVLPATRWTLGWADGGFALDIERGAESLQVPEFEIDAQPVSWAQYVEFIDDGGYDRADVWLPAGWDWLQREAARDGRRGPRHVEQIGAASGAVMQTLFGKPVRMSPSQSAMHLSWWEADAWARWAGRRLPTEVEWEMAAHTAARRGFRWGDVREWTASTLRPWPGFSADAWSRHTDFEAHLQFGRARVQRGASFAARSRMKHPKFRGFAVPARDDAFVGFRTCVM